ncbi:Glycosyl transferase family 2 [Thalassoglobus neptunius]|uniref:Glycosyl transferase family 2 n=1 Tax=Thalassoglobus neptunius TaxID=1938619 RepID=A0A5C5X3N8_9PLAN|nr:glycosyltransferase family 2 protein [Thalassoglobus neptunius]TWT57727.1 Glycosyl transferase family 2 [Thalassoglobus neptunius]
MTTESENSIDLLGVVIVTFGSSDVIVPCLESLAESENRQLRVVVVDNASTDDTVEQVMSWASDWNTRQPSRQINFTSIPLDQTDGPIEGSAPSVTLVRSPLNYGYAGACNIGLRLLNQTSDVDCFWILNPDCVVTPQTAGDFIDDLRKAGKFGLFGGRVLYHDPPQLIQSDGGRVGFWTGACTNVHQGLLPAETSYANVDTLNFISGANIIASREFYDTVGPMSDDYFLYFEEVDWACRRGDLPLKFSDKAVVYHHGGTSIGTGSVKRRASAFANYFNFRNRIKFIWRFNPLGVPSAYLFSVLLIVRLLTRGAWEEAYGALKGLHQMSPPRRVKERLINGAAVFPGINET